MNILYLHGFGSKYDPTSAKIQSLAKIGTVFGIDLDYSKSFASIKKTVQEAIVEHDIDLLVGTSLGGYIASQCGAGLPFVAINPVINPSQALLKYLDTTEDYYGRKIKLRPELIKKLPTFNTNGAGLILLDAGDDVINPSETRSALDNYYTVITHKGGDHRFQHMEESILSIEEFYFDCTQVYDLTND